MRKNLPVNDVETVIRPDQYLISKTNTKGVITYANPAFVEVSGFSYDELIGQPHNLVRHPDMPPEAFHDLWATLKSGKSWLGMVKNRRKDGGFYWVLANATPIVEHGEVVGYASVRVKPSEDQIHAARTFYADLAAGNAGGYGIRQGRKTATGWRRYAACLASPLRATLRASLFRLTAGFTLLAGLAYAAGNPQLLSHAVPAHWLIAGLAACALALSLYGWQIGKRILKSLDDVSDIARQISAGNLAVDIETDAQGETRLLYFYLDLMRKSLMDISGNVNAGVQSTVHTAAALNQSNARLAQRTQEQAASLHQTAANMEQFSVTVRQNTENALLASRLAKAGVQTAQRGGNAVAEVVATMQGIHESSSQVAEIVNLIEGIAFQTNILALNAAVESARAGDAGRGFAVVAGEVRSLAQKSSQAAKEIKELIDESVSRIAQGADQARQAGLTMGEIVKSVESTTEVMDQISSASIEQSAGLAQIRGAITQMDNSTQDNHRLVEELGRATALLSDDSGHLQRTIEVLGSGRRP